MVRALIAGVGDFPEQHVSEEDLAAGAVSFAPLAAVQPAVRELASALDRVGVVTGDALLECDRDAFLGGWRALRQAAEPHEPLIVHFAGHGVQAPSGGLFLAASGAVATGGLLTDTCVSFGQLLEEAQLGGRPVLFLLDVCQAGQAIIQQQLAELAARRAQDASRNVWIVGACASDAVTYGAGFTTAAAEVLQSLADGDLDINPALEYVPVETLAAAVDRHLARTDRAARRPRRAVVRTVHPAAVPEPGLFLRNPAHITGASTVPVFAGLDPRLREFALGCVPGLDPLHFATHAAGNPAADEILFTGRRSQLAQIRDWIDSVGHGGRLLAVTGGPGSGKSALLGVAACLLHPDLEPVLGRRVGNAVEHFEPTQPATVLAVHARQLSLGQITDALLAQLRRQRPDYRHEPGARPSPGPVNRGPGGLFEPVRTTAAPSGVGLPGLLREIFAAGDVLIILDALDEAVDGAAVAAELLLPLARGVGDGSGNEPAVRVLVGARPWWDLLAVLREYLVAHPGSQLNLDPTTDSDRDLLAQDLEGYLRKLLPRRLRARQQAHVIAEDLARFSDHGAFLAAALYADHLQAVAGQFPGSPPRTITEVFDLHLTALAGNDPWIRPVLAVLGTAKGQGMPADLIHAAVAANRDPSRPVPTQADTRRALAKAAFYLRTTPDDDQRLLYRYFHQTLADHIQDGTDPTAVHQALITTVPTRDDGTAEWARADPYLLRHAVAHAREADGAALDRLLTDLDYLVHADPDTLSAHLHHATTDEAILHGAIYRSSIPHHPDRGIIAARRDLLTLDALAWRQPSSAHTLNGTDGGRPFTPHWASHLTHPARRHTLTSHIAAVNTVLTTLGADGVLLAVTVAEDQSVIVWDLETGRIRHILSGPSPTRRPKTIRATTQNAALAISAVDGTVLAVTAGKDRRVIGWDVEAGTIRYTMSVPSLAGNAVATTSSADRTMLAISADQDQRVIVWDVEANAIRHTLNGHTGPVRSVTVTTDAHDLPLAVTAGTDGSMFVWDLRSGTIRHRLIGHIGAVNAVAITSTTDGTRLAITGGEDRALIVWDLETGTAQHTLLNASPVRTVAVTVGADGLPLAVTGGSDGRVTLWDLATGSMRQRLTDYTSDVNALAVTTDATGIPLAVIGGPHGTVIVWDLAQGRVLRTLTGHTDRVRAVAVATTADGASLAVTASRDGTAIVWDLDDDSTLHTLTGHSSRVLSMACATSADGTRLAITAGKDQAVIVWNLGTGGVRHTLTGHTDWVRAVTVATGADGSPLAITAGDDRTVMVWDLETGNVRHRLTGHTGWVLAAAATIGADGTQLAVTVGDDHTVIVWDIDTGTVRHRLAGHTMTVNAVSTTTSADGVPLAITGGFDETVIVWDLRSGTVLHKLARHTGWVQAVATITGTDGVPLAITTGPFGTVIVWDLETGTRRHQLIGHTGIVNAVVATTSAGGIPLAVTAGDDRAVIVWDLTVGNTVHTLTGHTGRVQAMTITTAADGTPIAVTTGDDRTVIAWNLEGGQEVYRCHLPHPGSRVCAIDSGFVVGYGPEVAYFPARQHKYPIDQVRTRGDTGVSPSSATDAAPVDPG